MALCPLKISVRSRMNESPFLLTLSTSPLTNIHVLYKLWVAMYVSTAS